MSSSALDGSEAMAMGGISAVRHTYFTKRITDDNGVSNIEISSVLDMAMNQYLLIPFLEG